jgi:broad specificity phosphatase PhoE
MRRLLLVRHASTRALRRACFAPEDPLDAHGREQAAALRAELRRDARFLVAPSLAAFQTASLAGCAPLIVEQALADCDYGRWSGRALDDVRRDEPDGVEIWLSDPDAVPHGGESLRALVARIGGWLDDEAAREGTVVAVAAGAVVRAAVVCALDAPADALWRIDVAPASVTELHAHDRRWKVTRVNDRSATRAAPTAPAASGSADADG